MKFPAVLLLNQTKLLYTPKQRQQQFQAQRKNQSPFCFGRGQAQQHLKLGAQMAFRHTLQCFDLSDVIFVYFMFSLLCAPAVNGSFTIFFF